MTGPAALKGPPVGASVRFVAANGIVAMGVVRERTPKRILAWFGQTGFGQRRWPFDDKGLPVGPTAVAFPGCRLDLSHSKAFAADPPVRTFRCSGCFETDVSPFNKAGVEHWKRTPDEREVICGHWSLLSGGAR